MNVKCGDCGNVAERQPGQICRKCHPNIPEFLVCLRCDHRWPPRVENPKRCPNCVSPYWDMPYTRPRPVKA